MMYRIIVAGRKTGESNPRAKLTNHEVELIRVLREEHGLSLDVLANKFEVSKTLVAGICCYSKRRYG